MNADQRAARRAADQYALLSSDDCRAAGLSDDQVERRIRTRGWRRWARGVYLLPGSAPRSWRQDAMAGVLLCRPRARASHLTACALHDFCRAPVLPHITVPRRSSARTRLVALHRSDLHPADCAVVDGIPCTTASRAIVEAASVPDRPMLEEVIDQALCAKRATVASIQASLRRAGRRWPGAARLRDALVIWAAAIEPGSPAEVRFLRRLLEWGADGLVTQHEILDEEGQFVARVDVAVPECKHAFEYDSDLHHNPRATERDEARRARLERLGWRVDEVSKQDMLPSATRIRDLLRARTSA